MPYGRMASAGFSKRVLFKFRVAKHLKLQLLARKYHHAATLALT